jgi:hypothetical protein
MPKKLSLAKVTANPARGVAPLLADVRGLILTACEWVARSFPPVTKSIEFERFGNCGEFATIKATRPRQCLVSIPWNSTGLANQPTVRARS